MILTVDDISFGYGNRKILDGVSFTLERGCITSLIGRNGAGKTTSFYMIVGFIKANGGSVMIDGHDITSLPMHKRSKMGLAYLPQEPSIFRKLSVENNIRLVLETQKDLSKADREEMLEKLIDDFGIQKVRKQYGYTLSGGERRRTEIARSLATSPKFLLLDEFDAELDIDLWCLIHLLEVDKVVKACAFLRKLELRLLLLESAFDEVVKNEVRVFQEGRAAATHHREDVDAREGGLETFPG